MAGHLEKNNRVADRRRVLKGAVIAYSGRCVTLPCVVRDLSGTGARLQVRPDARVPDTFDLLIELDGFEAECVVVWRTAREIGLRFLAEPTRVAPKRGQVVKSMTDMPKPSLRRARTGHEPAASHAAHQGAEAQTPPVAAEQPAIPPAGMPVSGDTFEFEAETPAAAEQPGDAPVQEAGEGPAPVDEAGSQAIAMIDTRQVDAAFAELAEATVMLADVAKLGRAATESPQDADGARATAGQAREAEFEILPVAVNQSPQLAVPGTAGDAVTLRAPDAPATSRPAPANCPNVVIAPSVTVTSLRSPEVSQPDAGSPSTGTGVTPGPAAGAGKIAPKRNIIPILIAEDDPDDRLLIEEAFGETDFDHPIDFVANGEELLAYLDRTGSHGDHPRPGLVLLDLNMPRMDGRTALTHIKANPAYRSIPIVIFTTSNADEDIDQTYDLGVSSYITKPSSFDGLKEVIRTLNIYWNGLVALPGRPHGGVTH